MSRTDQLLLKLVERYQFHKNYKTRNSDAAKLAQKMCDIELSEMWMLTQSGGNHA